MADKTQTVVVIEHHEQTIIRRSRRVEPGEVPGAAECEALTRPLVTTRAEAPTLAGEVMLVSPKISRGGIWKYFRGWLRTIAPRR